MSSGCALAFSSSCRATEEQVQGLQHSAEQLLAAVCLQAGSAQQPGHLPLASLTAPLLQQLSQHVHSLQQHFGQHHQPHQHRRGADGLQQLQLQQHTHQQPDRTAPLFTLSEFTQRHSSADKKKQEQQQLDRNKLRTRGSHENPASMPGTLCVETDAGGRQRVYRTRSGVDKGSGKMWEGFDMVGGWPAANIALHSQAPS